MSVVVDVDFRPGRTRAEELLVYLRIAGRSGLTSREMDGYMPRGSWQGALRDLENAEKWPGLILDVERRPRRPRRRAWVRVVLKGEFTPSTAAAPEPDLEPAQPTLFDDTRDEGGRAA